MNFNYLVGCVNINKDSHFCSREEIASLKSQVRDLTIKVRESNDENAKLKKRLSVTPSIEEESQLTEGM